MEFPNIIDWTSLFPILGMCFFITLFKEVLAIRRLISLVDMIKNTNFSNCSNVSKIGVEYCLNKMWSPRSDTSYKHLIDLGLHNLPIDGLISNLRDVRDFLSFTPILIEYCASKK